MNKKNRRRIERFRSREHNPQPHAVRRVGCFPSPLSIGRNSEEDGRWECVVVVACAGGWECGSAPPLPQLQEKQNKSR